MTARSAQTPLHPRRLKTMRLNTSRGWVAIGSAALRVDGPATGTAVVGQLGAMPEAGRWIRAMCLRRPPQSSAQGGRRS
jgi:hypothetical protein